MRPVAPVSPGEMLEEEFLKPLGLTKYRLANYIGLPKRSLPLFKGVLCWPPCIREIKPENSDFGKVICLRMIAFIDSIQR